MNRYVPGVAAVTGLDVAVAVGGVGGVGAGPESGEIPAGVPPTGLEHGAAPGGSLKTVNVTVPVGVGPLATPVTVAVSVKEVPSGTTGVPPPAGGGAETRVAMAGVAWLTVTSPTPVWGAPPGRVGTEAVTATVWMVRP